MPNNTTAQQLKSDKRSCARQWIITLNQDSLSPSGCRRTFWAFEHPIHRTVAVFDIHPPFTLTCPPTERIWADKGRRLFVRAVVTLAFAVAVFPMRRSLTQSASPSPAPACEERQSSGSALGFRKRPEHQFPSAHKASIVWSPTEHLIFVCFHNENNKHKMILKEKKIHQ